MSMAITIEEGATTEIGITETPEQVSVQVADADMVEIEIADNGNNTVLEINESGQLVEVGVSDTTEIVELLIDEASEVVIVIDETQRQPLLDDLTKQVDIDAGAPVGGTNVWTLPAEWTGKRIRVIRNGIKFYNWTRTSTGIELDTPGDVWLGTSANGAGFEETVSIENY